MENRIVLSAKAEEVPTVSVIIPTYNRAHLVGRAVRSVLAQTYQDFEVIVVDDGSVDNTQEMMKGFNEKGIIYIKHPSNKGVSAARNTGIKHAKGKYVAFQDSDDEWLPDKLEKQIRVFENAKPDTGLIYTGMWRIKNNRKKFIPGHAIKKREGNIHDILLERCFVGTPTTLIRKECFKRIGMFDENLRCADDWDMWIRISEHYAFAYIDEPLVISHCQPDSISQDRDTGPKASEMILAKHYGKFSKDKRLLGKRLYWIGNLFCYKGDMSQGRKYFLRSLRSYPLNIKCLIAFVLSFFGKRAYSQAVRLKRNIL